jgi:hypothetical protein
MLSVTFSGVASTLMTLARTLVPSQFTTAATNGTGTPGAANVTIVKERTVPSVLIFVFLKSVAKHDAHALRRSKKRAPHAVHSFATK